MRSRAGARDPRWIALYVLCGGVLTQSIDWHWIFFVNVPIGIAVVAAAARLLERDRGLGLHVGSDLPGALLITAALMLAVYTIVKPAAQDGWGAARTLELALLCIVLLTAFFAREATANRPLVPQAGGALGLAVLATLADSRGGGLIRHGGGTTASLTSGYHLAFLDRGRAGDDGHSDRACHPPGAGRRRDERRQPASGPTTHATAGRPADYGARRRPERVSGLTRASADRPSRDAETGPPAMSPLTGVGRMQY
ncbi:MAG: hypothetical protein ACLP50_16160 [Solirubrobacteraceae bacterium]